MSRRSAVVWCFEVGYCNTVIGVDRFSLDSFDVTSLFLNDVNIEFRICVIVIKQSTLCIS